MPRCSHCQTDHTDPVRCPSCGVPVAGPADGADPRQQAADHAETRALPPGRQQPGDAAPDQERSPRYPGGVELGDLIAGRYRILARLGAGNMGTVYRARDEQLEADVALKFLTAQCAIDTDCAAQLTQEVRVARQVSHENVCRVHDLGDHQGRQFVSMEFIAGEDLGSRLGRRGSLPVADRDRIARQLCSGLHAVHAKGILHCDLKPANVLLDADDNVRIVDFGIASAADSDRGDRIVGSPAYMAPEILAGSPNSTASDIYAMGLLFYELYCGEAWIDAGSLTEIFEQHRRPAHRRPGNFADLDFSRERLIRAMTVTNPSQRPTALDVLARLPGGDPLATALATGSTPSPELVAAAGGATLIRHRTAWLLVLATVLGVVLLGVLGGGVRTIDQLTKSESLDETASRLLTLLAPGPQPPPWMRTQHIELQSPVDSVGQPLATTWFRPRDAASPPRNVKGRVRFDDPPFTVPGMTRLRLRLDGTLCSFEAIPSARSSADSRPPNWQPILRASGLDPERLRPANPPPPSPRIASTHQWAFEGVSNAGDPIRVEAASYGATPVLLTVVPRAEEPARPAPGTWRTALSATLMWAALSMAWWSLRQRQSDVRGAFRLAVTTVVMVLAFTLLAGDHDGTAFGWLRLLQGGLGHGLLVGGQLAVYYLALEPHVRRIWPEMLIAWSRLLAGATRDSLVGYHLLIGAVLGVAMALIRFQGYLLERALESGATGPRPTEAGLLALAGPVSGTGALLELAIDRTRDAMLFLFGLVLLRMILRRRIAAAALAILIFTAVFHQPGDRASWQWIGLTVTLITVTVFTIQAVRFGVLSVLVSLTLLQVLVEFPLQFWSSSKAFWAASPALLLTGALLIHGYWTATRPSPSGAGRGTGRFTVSRLLPFGTRNS